MTSKWLSRRLSMAIIFGIISSVALIALYRDEETYLNFKSEAIHILSDPRLFKTSNKPTQRNHQIGNSGLRDNKIEASPMVKISIPEVNTSIPKTNTSIAKTNISIPKVNTSIHLPLQSNLNSKQYNSSHIVYLKVHKAASSTLQSIIMRAGMKRNLTFALPQRRTPAYNQLGWPGKFSRKRNLRPEIKNPEVLCFHAVLSDDMVNTMPADSFYFTSLRDPFTQIKSTYEYYQMSHCMKSKDPISLMSLLESQRTSCAVVIKNPQAFDLGLSLSDTNKSGEIRNLVHRVEKLFHFVIIVDYFDECLILLRDMLGWTNSDILYFKTNFNGKTQRKPEKEALLPVDNKENRDKVYKYLQADYALYIYFKLKLQKVISQKRKYLDVELVKLKELQKEWMSICVKQTVPSGKIQDARFRPYGDGSYGYLLTDFGYKNSTCVDLTIVETPHVKVLGEYQDRLLNQSISHS